jgi:hypothetical protein
MIDDAVESNGHNRSECLPICIRIMEKKESRNLQLSCAISKAMKKKGGNEAMKYLHLMSFGRTLCLEV